MPFKSTEFMSAEEKEAVLMDWQRFVKSDFDRKYFTEKLYDHLHLHCSFIAHFNIHGFYGTYFENPEHTLEFLKQFDRDFGHKSTEYGSTYWFTSEEYHDINSELANSLEPYKSKIYAGLKQKTREMKLKQIDRLKSEIEDIE